MKIYFKGDSGISEPFDMDGKRINEGDILTKDFGDYEKYNIEVGEDYPTTPFYIVKKNEKGFYFAESIEPCMTTIEKTYFFLHDFRFKYCKKL